MARSPATVAQSAEWLAHRYDETADRIHFRHVPRARHAAATFLTDEYLGIEPEPFVLSRKEAMAVASPPGAVHFIFHSAFCCSTLLARAFDIPGKAMGLKEPQILNDITGWRLRAAPGPQVAERLDHALRLLARPFGSGEATIIKPSNVINGLAPAMMTLRPDANALLLRAPLPVFLRSVARKGMDGRIWVRDLMTKQIKEGLIDLGFEHWDYLGLTDLQAAAIGWLAQQHLFQRMAAEFANRVRTLDSETLLARPDEGLSATAELFGIDLSNEERAAILAGPAFATNSKTGDAFTTVERAQGYAEAAAAHADELEKVAAWAEVVAANAGVKLDLPNPLLA
jgi:hypothetical protein